MKKVIFPIVVLGLLIGAYLSWAGPSVQTAPGASTAYVDAADALKLNLSTTYGQANTVFAAAATTSGYASMRALVDADLPATSNAAAIALKLTTPSGDSNTVYAGGATTNAATPSMRSLVDADLPAASNAASIALKLSSPTGTSNTVYGTQGTTTNQIITIAIGEQQVVGRLTGGNVKGLSQAELQGVVIPPGVALDSPNIGAATGTSLTLTGPVTGTSNVVFMTSATTTHTVSSTSNANAYYFQNGNSFVQLPTAAAGLQYCFKNYTGITTALSISTSAAGQYIDLDGTNSASGGRVKTAGAAGDGICVVGTDATQWVAWCSKGTCSLD